MSETYSKQAENQLRNLMTLINNAAKVSADVRSTSNKANIAELNDTITNLAREAVIFRDNLEFVLRECENTKKYNRELAEQLDHYCIEYSKKCDHH